MYALVIFFVLNGGRTKDPMHLHFMSVIKEARGKGHFRFTRCINDYGYYYFQSDKENGRGDVIYVLVGTSIFKTTCWEALRYLATLCH